MNSRTPFESSGFRAKLPTVEDRDGLGQVLDAFRHYLLAVARRKIDPGLSPKAGASDLVQDTLLEAQRDFASFHGESEADMLAWVRKLLLNNLSNFHRRYRGSAKRSVVREVGIEAATFHSSCAQSFLNPGTSAENEDEIRLLREHIARLPPAHNRVLSLWNDGLSFDEIGLAMERSTDAARMLWMRAVERLKVMVESP